MTTFTYFLLIGFDWADKVETETKATELAAQSFGLEMIYRITEDRSEKPTKIAGTDCTEELAQIWWHHNAADKFDAIPAIFDPFIPQSEVEKYL